MTVILLGALCPEMVLSGMSGILLGMMVQKNSPPLNIHEETWALKAAGSSLWLQEEQALGWGQQCGWQAEQKEGSWALEPIRHLACLPSGLPPWTSKPLTDIYLSWFLRHITENTHFPTLFFALSNFISHVDLLSHCSRRVDDFHIEV